MPTMEELLDPEVIAKMAEAAEPKRECLCERRSDGFRLNEDGVAVHKTCGNPRPPVSMFLSPGNSAKVVTVDCEGGCGTPIKIAVREVPDRHRNKPRYRVCAECAATMIDGSTVTVVAPPQKEAPVAVDLSANALSDAEVGATVRKAAIDKIAADLPKKRKKAKAKAAKKDKAAKKAKRAERADLAKIVLPGFEFQGIEVPTLDLGEINNLDEAVSGTVRSPYNKVRYRLHMTPLPSATKAQIKQDPTTPVTTWAMLANAHAELLDKVANVAEAKAKPKKPTKKKHEKALVSAPLSLDEKIDVLREQFGVTKKQARKMLAEIGY